ncbi:Crp/Fnr family transcriptional regulator [Mucilaginibacter sp. KACC 22773]|uniref:Crp/Fnr family transcriptional regulator n=1 Tax=Mucilaginibacter sp. KACC 22773 TaxID=3025671 RepID=UPI002365B6F4|nr:Crp/Fnr family transcriptional regulator [Mucilaginibacter sp. KACC 22773]WDF78440.1 Crp/Fnr family transcriptional regulator [Mucilaginibacter sp. KACC 22773]
MKDQAIIQDYLDHLFSQFEPGLKAFLVQNASVIHIPAGEVALRTGQYIKSTMMILSGRVKLYREGDDGGEFFMYYLEPGNACALTMICATKQETSEVMGKAIEDTTILAVPIALMDQMMVTYKTWYYFVLETYRSRYEELLIVIDHIAFKGMDERLYYYLQNQYQKLKMRELKITHSQIAADLNSSREVISRLLKKMEQRGDIVLTRNFIEWKK